MTQFICQWLVVLILLFVLMVNTKTALKEESLGERETLMVGTLFFGFLFTAILYGAGAFTVLFGAR